MSESFPDQAAALARAALVAESSGLTVLDEIDAAAHRSGLGAGLITVAVLQGGLNRLWRRGHQQLTEAITERGTLVSEHPTGQRVTTAWFLACNRIIAALASGSVIAEAEVRSNALEADRHARALGRPVMAVPGSTAEDWSSECHALIRRGQTVLVTVGEDVIETITSAWEVSAGGHKRSTR